VNREGQNCDAVLLDGSPSKLCASPHYSARASRDVESLADGLWKILGSSICEGRFSYRGGIWQEFDADDLTFIRYAFENLLEPYEEVPLNWNKWIRQTHRWLSVAFTAGVIVNIVAVGQKQYTVWVGLSALVPLALQLITGWYLFVLPYAAKWRSRPRIGGTGG